MKKTETMRQSAAASNEQRVAELADQIKALRQARHRSVEELAADLEPLAQALATLADETRQTLAELQRQSRTQSENLNAQMTKTAQVWREAATEARQAADTLVHTQTRMRVAHYVLTVAVAALTAVLVSAFWLWLAPPTVQNVLDARALAEYLKPALTETKPARNR